MTKKRCGSDVYGLAIFGTAQDKLNRTAKTVRYQKLIINTFRHFCCNALMQMRNNQTTVINIFSDFRHENWHASLCMYRKPINVKYRAIYLTLVLWRSSLWRLRAQLSMARK
jgi:hypothetical protein